MNIKKALRGLDQRFEEYLLIALMAMLVIAVDVQVFKRYILNSADPYLEEISRFGMIWMVYIALPYAIKMRKHITVDVLPSTLSPLINAAINILAGLLILVLAVVMVVKGYQSALQQLLFGQKTEAMQIPIFYFSCAPMVGFLLGIIRLFQNFAVDFKALLNPSSVGEVDHSRTDLI